MGDPDSFPRLKKTNSAPNPGDVFNGVELLQGWLVVNDAGAEAGIAGSRFTWKMRESDDIKSDRERLALDLMTSLDARVNAVVTDGAFSILEVFDAAKLVSLQCGSISGEDIKLLLPEGEYESFGVDQCRRVLETSSNMLHIKESGMNFDPCLAYRYMNLINFCSSTPFRIRLRHNFSNINISASIYPPFK